MDDTELLTMMLRAMESEYGIAIRTDNPTLLRNRLYKLKKTQPSLSELALVSPPVNSDTTLWLVRKDK